MVPVYLISELGAEVALEPPASGFASKEEEVVWYALKQRLVPFIYQWWPFGSGDIPTTPGREAKSADFAIPARHLIINPTSAFTHSDPLRDQEIREQFLDIGYETHFLPSEQIMPPANVHQALDRIIGFFGQSPKLPTAYHQKITFGQPSIDKSFQYFARLGRFG